MHSNHGAKIAKPLKISISVLIFILSFSIHFALVQVGSLFTIPFGFASVIWPATGVILGLYLLFGWPVLVAAFCSLSIVWLQDSVLSQVSLGWALLLSVIGCIQLMFCRWLVFRVFALPVRVSYPFEIIKFLIVTGPVSSLVTALCVGVVLCVITPLLPEVVIYIAVTKWVGDAFSIIFLTPIILFLYPNRFVKKAKKPFAAIVTSVVAYLMVSFIFSVSQANFERDRREEFVNTTAPFVEQISSAQSTIKLYLKALEAFFQASALISREEFNDFTAIVQDEKVKVRAIGWLPLIRLEDKEAFESVLAAESFNNKEIKQLTSSGFIKAPQQDFYLPIKYLAPLAGNQAAIGLDIASHPIAGATAKNAIETHTFSITPLLSLAQQQNKTTGVVVYYPVFAKSEPKNLHSLIGLTEVVLELEVLLDPVFGHDASRPFSYQLQYGNNVFSNGSFESLNALVHAVEFSLFDKKAVLTFSSTDVFERTLVNWVDFVIVLIGSILGVICVFFVFVIVSFNSHLKKKVSSSTHELQKKNTELIKANEAKNLFLANISHEYRTPLNAIMGFCDIAKRETHEAHIQDYLAKIHDASTILLGTVNDVLDFSKMQAGQLELDMVPFNPKTAVLSVVDMLNDKASTKGLIIACHFNDEFSTSVEGDDLRFKQIMINLLNNAIKFTDEGTITLFGECSINKEECNLLIKVVDTGIGIALHNQEKLFQSFSQAQGSITRKYGGTGLGLSIVKQLCGLMGGNVVLRSEFGQGAEFIVTLTLQKASAAESQCQSSEGDAENFDFSAMKVLVVEDNKINQIVVQKHLQNLNINCDIVNDGLEALDYLKCHIPDLILMDLQMPNMDGFTASELIRQAEMLRHIPIVILSASVGKAERDKAAALGINGFINKPFSETDLKAVLIKHQVKV